MPRPATLFKPEACKSVTQGKNPGMHHGCVKCPERQSFLKPEVCKSVIQGKNPGMHHGSVKCPDRQSFLSRRFVSLLPKVKIQECIMAVSNAPTGNTF